MKENKIGIERIAQVAILCLSVASLALGIFLSFAIALHIIYCDDKILCGYVLGDADFKFIGILIAGGLLGTSLDFVLKKIIKEYVKKILDDGTIEDLVGEKVQESKYLEIEEEEETREEEKKQSDGLDTVIVPIAKTYSSIVKYKEYKCPSDRSFKKGLKYIAFYKSKEIIGYGEIVGSYEKKENEEWLSFKFKNFIKRSIPHNEKGAFVQNKMYCNYQSLINAKNTTEIRN